MGEGCFQLRGFARKVNGECRNLRWTDGRKVFDVLRLRESERRFPSALSQFFHDLERAHARQDGMSWKVRSEDGMICLQVQLKCGTCGQFVGLVGEMKERIKELHVKKLVRE